MRYFEIVDQLLDYSPNIDVSLLGKAYVFSAKVHQGRADAGGEPYLEHPLAVAGILAGMRLDEESIAAASHCDWGLSLLSCSASSSAEGTIPGTLIPC